MSNTTHDIVAKLWNLCNILKDGAIVFHKYVTEQDGHHLKKGPVQYGDFPLRPGLFTSGGMPLVACPSPDSAAAPPLDDPAASPTAGSGPLSSVTISSALLSVALFSSNSGPNSSMDTSLEGLDALEAMLVPLRR